MLYVYPNRLVKLAIAAASFGIQQVLSIPHETLRQTPAYGFLDS